MTLTPYKKHRCPLLFIALIFTCITPLHAADFYIYDSNNKKLNVKLQTKEKEDETQSYRFKKTTEKTTNNNRIVAIQTQKKVKPKKKQIPMIVTSNSNLCEIADLLVKNPQIISTKNQYNVHWWRQCKLFWGSLTPNKYGHIVSSCSNWEAIITPLFEHHAPLTTIINDLCDRLKCMEEQGSESYKLITLDLCNNKARYYVKIPTDSDSDCRETLNGLSKQREGSDLKLTKLKSTPSLYSDSDTAELLGNEEPLSYETNAMRPSTSKDNRQDG